MSDFDLNKALTFFVPSAISAGVRYPDYVQAAKRAFIQEVLDRHHGNQSRAARELGMHRNTLERTLRELELVDWLHQRWPYHRQKRVEASVA